MTNYKENINSSPDASSQIFSPIPNSQLLIPLLTSLADDTLIMSQRLSEWTGHGPALEQDIAITNIALDYLGQARMFFQYIAEIKNDGSTEDSIAYLRDAQEYRNHLLAELPNGDWAQTVLKIFFFAAWQKGVYEQLLYSNDRGLSAIAEKSLKEVRYHLKWSNDWVIRLGDGSSESHARINNALGYLWNYTGELFEPLPGKMAGIDYGKLKEDWQLIIDRELQVATLETPVSIPFHSGGLNGIHTEHLGYILTDLQWMQRVYPNSEW